MSILVFATNIANKKKFFAHKYVNFGKKHLKIQKKLENLDFSKEIQFFPKRTFLDANKDPDTCYFQKLIFFSKKLKVKFCPKFSKNSKFFINYKK